LTRQRHALHHQLLASAQVTVVVVAPQEPLLVDLQLGNGHTGNITLLAGGETRKGKAQPAAPASSTISSRSSRRVIANTR
jgi:hypothetical protein